MTDHQNSSAATEVLDFLNSIEGAGYGGMASFEIARQYVREMVMNGAAQSVQVTDDELFDLATKAWESQTSSVWYTDAIHAVIDVVRDSLASQPSPAATVETVNMPFERLPQHAGDSGFGPVPNVVPLRSDDPNHPSNIAADDMTERAKNCTYGNPDCPKCNPVPRSSAESSGLIEAGLRHADGLTAQLAKPDWIPRRSHIEQARNTIVKLSGILKEIDEHGPGRPGQSRHQVVPSDPAYDGAAGGSPARHTPTEPQEVKVLHALQSTRACLEWLDRRGGLGLDVHAYIRTVLADTSSAVSRPNRESGK